MTTEPHRCQNCGSVIVENRTTHEWVCRNIFCIRQVEGHPAPAAKPVVEPKTKKSS